MRNFVNNIVSEINHLPDMRYVGQVSDVVGLLIEIGGVRGATSVGDHCIIRARGRDVRCEVVGFRNRRALVMPFGAAEGIGMGCTVEFGASEPAVFPTNAWLGRVVNAFGQPVDGKGPLETGPRGYAIQSDPPPAHQRSRLGGKVDVGVRAMNTFLTCCQGQRMGIFAGSGVGKSTLLSMMARDTDAEVSIVGLIGERGREAREFIEDNLGEEGLARSVVIVATSDEPPLVRRQAAFMTLAISEYFRDAGNNVLCLMDSVTRFAMAQREISLAVGEPPASKGYTPSVFALLPRLLERAGPGVDGSGDITGLFTVLVEGDDHNEPVADAVRGILDGHVVLERAIAERGRYPAINILKSVSRTMPGCNTQEQNELVSRARQLMATYEDMAELIRLGAYRRGSDPKVDEAIQYYPGIEAFLTQQLGDSTDLPTCYQMLADVLGLSMDGTAAQAVPGQPVQGGPVQGGQAAAQQTPGQQPAPQQMTAKQGGAARAQARAQAKAQARAQARAQAAAQQTAPQPGAPQPGAPQPGAPQPAAARSAAPPPGAAQPGAPKPAAAQPTAPGPAETIIPPPSLGATVAPGPAPEEPEEEEKKEDGEEQAAAEQPKGPIDRNALREQKRAEREARRQAREARRAQRAKS